MLAQYQSNVKATISFIKQLNVKVNNTTVNETLQNHPDWPSMLCISDSLNKWNIPNGVGRIEKEKIDELPTPFIAYTNDRENPLAIISKINQDKIELYQRNYNKSNIQTTENFLNHWDGLYLIAEPNKYSGEQNYSTKRKKEIINSLIPVAAVILLIFSSFLVLNRSVETSFSLHSAVYFQYFILLTGMVVTSLLLWYEIDKNNPILQKVCTGIAKGNCNAILTGKQSKVFSWLSWSEVGFFYFIGSLLSLLIVPNSINALSWLGIFALPYTVFSIYYQWRVAKQWCLLCLAVQAFLLLGAMNVLLNDMLFPLVHLSFSTIVTFLLVFTSPFALWFTVKPYILRLQEAKNTKREYLRIKFNSVVFETLLKKQKQIMEPVEGLGIDIGNPNAINTIVKVCNPYCDPCAKAHPQIEALVEKNTNVNAKIIFTTSNDENNPAIKPVRHLLAIAEEGIQDKTKHALDNWYLATTKDYTIFEKKYPLNGQLLQQGDKIEAMEKWSKDTGITFTPTFFINGYQLPDAYNVEDLQYFLLE